MAPSPLTPSTSGSQAEHRVQRGHQDEQGHHLPHHQRQGRLVWRDLQRRQRYAKAEYVTATDTIDSGYVQVTSQTLKLRSGAGTDYDQLAIVPYGTVLKIHGSLGSWYQVKYNSKEGYVCGDYTSTTTSSGYKAYPDFAKVTASALGLRVKPGTDSEKSFTIPNGTIVSVRGMQDGWYKVVVYGTHTGYIDPSYTERSSGPATVPQVTTTTTTGTTTTGTTTGSTTTSSSSSSSSSSNYSSGSSGGGSGSAVLAYAQQFVGNPYQVGRHQPDQRR